MSMPLQRIAIKPSARLGPALCAIHGTAAATVWFTPVAWWLQAVLTFAIAWSLAHALSRNAALRGAGAIVTLEVSREGQISFQSRRGDWRPCELLGSSYVSPWLTILNLKPEGGRWVRYVVLVTDNVEAGEFRRLRTWLRWAAKEGAEDRGSVSASARDTFKKRAS